MKETIEKNTDHEPKPSERLFNTLSKSIGIATANTVLRYYDLLPEWQDVPATAETKEDNINSFLKEFNISKRYQGVNAIRLIQKQVGAYISNGRNGLLDKHHSLKLQIASEGGNTFGSNMDQRLVEFGEHLDDAFQAQREVQEYQNQFSN